MITRWTVLPLLTLLLLPACSRKETGSTTSTQAPGAQGGYQAVSDVPQDLQQKVRELALSLENDIQENNVAGVRDAFDITAVVDAICDGVQASGLALRQFKSGLQKGMDTSIERITTMWSEQSPKFKALTVYNGEIAARFRFVSQETGIAFVDMIYRTNKLGELHIVNFCNHAMGYDLVEQSRQTTAPMLADIDKSFLERLVNKPGISRAEIDRFGKLSKAVQSGDFNAAIQAYESLTSSLRDTMSATAMYLMALQKSGDDQKYKAALQDAAKTFNTASFQFMLVDVYALDKEFAKAAQCIDSFMQLMGPDAALLALKSTMLNANSEIPAARQTLQDAFSLEPDCAFVHATGLDVLLAAKDWPAVRNSIIFLEQNADYDFKGSLTDSIWDEFKKTPESTPWR